MKVGDTITIVVDLGGTLILHVVPVAGVSDKGVFAFYARHGIDRPFCMEGTGWLRGDHRKTEAGRALLTAAVLGSGDQAAS